MRHFFRVIVRFSVVWVLEALSLLVMSWFVPGIRLLSWESADILTVAMSVALVLAIMNGLVRPLLILLTLPLSVLSLGLSTLFINAGMLILTAYFLPYFEVNGWIPAILGTLILTVVNTILTSLTTIDDDYSFFDGVVQWLSKRQYISSFGESGRGLVMLEIDGLSYPRIQRAVEQNLMPTVREMMENGTHVVSHYDCGLPSQTSSCQAGIMYGDNFDIPAFRWYDKDRGKMLVSNNFHDASEMNAWFAHGNGLLRGGSGICNHMAGDAAKTLLTMSVLTGSNEDMQRRSLEDLYLFWLNPYIFTRSLVLTLWDILVELWQGFQQRIRNVRPRVNRLHKGYPFLRAITNVLLRDLGTYMVVLDVIRGAPAIYTTYVGYDEVAHHAGPDTPDAMSTLKGLDTQLRRIREVIRYKAPRPYDVFLLSDHGQAVGATFEQRYGYTLAEFIGELVKEDVSVAEVNATENSQGHAMAFLAEIQAMEQQVAMGRVRGGTLGRARKAIQKRVDRWAPTVNAQAEVVVCASGNLANVYFTLRPGKIGLPELNETYPGLVDALVAHPGVGFVVAYDQHDTPLVLGAEGARKLQTGTVTGSDPLESYGDADHRAMQLLCLAQFPHAGDLIVNSTLYGDGQVAAFEELVGSHGGLGGQQTDAFLFHPADMVVPPTSNATEVFALLDARRGLPGEPLQPHVEPVEEEKSWSLKTLLAGVRDVRTWVPRAVGAFRLDRAAFHEVAADPFATGPALLIVLATLFIMGLAGGLDPDVPGSLPGKVASEIFGGFVGWILMVFLATIAGQVLSGKGDFTRTLRALGFAQMPHVISVLGLLPCVGGLLSFIASMLVLLATWIALQEALRLRRLLAALIPIVGLLVVFVASLVAGFMLGGTVLTLEAVLLRLGFSPRP
ncbi:MAG: phage holin family protein [Promethearchaeota archaeon]